MDSESTAVANRQDVHKPSVIIPEDYEYVALECVKIEHFGDCELARRERAVLNAHMARTGGTWSRHAHGGNCMVCGAWMIYSVAFYHEPSNTYVRTGQICAEKLEWANPNAFKAYKTACKAALANRAGKAKAEQVLAENGVSETAWAIYESWDYDTDLGNYQLNKMYRTIADIVAKQVRWGNISDKAMAYVKRLANDVDNWEAIQAKRDAAKALIPDVPEGRQEMTGFVVSTRVDEDEYSDRTFYKMLVETDEGYKVWGSVPNSLFSAVDYRLDHLRGRRIKFRGTNTKSNDDRTFGFFKRPSNAVFLDEDLIKRICIS
jgi:hypothetical protein